MRVRSPEATAIINIAPESKSRSRPIEVECPRCGHFNAVRDTFNCKGACGKLNLCHRHFDEEHEVCKWCADDRRNTTKAGAERQAELQADLATWHQRAEQAETLANKLTNEGQQTQQALEQAHTELRQVQDRVQSLEQDFAAQRLRAEKAEADVATLTQRSQQAETNLNLRVAALSQAKEHVGKLEELQALNERLRSDHAGLLVQFGQAQQERDSCKATLETLARDLGTAQSELAASNDKLAKKEVALNEAYLRAVKLQRQLMEHQSVLAATQSELAAQRRRAEQAESAESTSRGETAGELALLTSTMLRVKEEQLERANEQLQRLQQELDDLRQDKN